MRFKGVGLLVLTLTFLALAGSVYAVDCASGYCYDIDTCAIVEYEFDEGPPPQWYLVYLPGENCPANTICQAGVCVTNVPGCDVSKGQIPCGGTGTCIYPSKPNTTAYRNNCTLNGNIVVTVNSSKNYYYFDNLTIPSGYVLNFQMNAISNGLMTTPSAKGGLYGVAGTPNGGGGSGGRGGTGGNTTRKGSIGTAGSHGGPGDSGIPGGRAVVNSYYITVNGRLSADGTRGLNGGSASGADCNFWGACTGRGGGGGGPGGGGGDLTIWSNHQITGTGSITARGGEGGTGGGNTNEDSQTCSGGDDWGAAGGGGGGGGGGVVRMSAPSVSPIKNCTSGGKGLGGCWWAPGDFKGTPGQNGVNGNCTASYVLPESCNNGIDDDNDNLTDGADMDCKWCGNGIVETPNNQQLNEECDDQDNDPNDGCHQCRLSCPYFNPVTYKSTNYKVIPNTGCYHSVCNGVFPIKVITTETAPPRCDTTDGFCLCDGSCASNNEGNCKTGFGHYCDQTSCYTGTSWVSCGGGGSGGSGTAQGDINTELVNNVINVKDDSLLELYQKGLEIFNPIQTFAEVNNYCTCVSGAPVCGGGTYTGYTLISNNCPSSCTCSPGCWTPISYEYCWSTNTEKICNAYGGSSGMCIPYNGSATVYGVYLNKTQYHRSNGEFFRCGLADGVCPDDFSDQTPGQCGTSGVCTSHGISDPDCNICGNGVLDPGEKCDGNLYNNSATCSSFGYAYGNLSCTGNCQVINTDACKYNITSVTYSLGNGCNPATNTCGSNSLITITTNFTGVVSSNFPIIVDVNVRSPARMVQGQNRSCIIDDLAQGVIGSTTSGSKSWGAQITQAKVMDSLCNNATLQFTNDSMMLTTGGAQKSNEFDRPFTAPTTIRLRDCGDGGVDNFTGYYAQYNEECDGTNFSGLSCLNFTYAPGKYYTGGYLWCNSVCDIVTSGCSACGDGVPEGSEQCDHGTDNSPGVLHNGPDMPCRDNCTWSYCGDDFPQTSYYGNGKQYSTTINPPPFYEPPPLDYTAFIEQCDDGDGLNVNACLNNCSENVCGDGIKQSMAIPPDVAEQCDNGTLNNNQGSCDLNCFKTSCGDRNVQWPNGWRVNGTLINGSLGYEQCDPQSGIRGPTTACNYNCTNTFCGDGIVQNVSPRWEQCEPPMIGCNANCKYSVCGDGIVGIGEECDNRGKCTNAPATSCSTDLDCPIGRGPCDLNYHDGCSAQCTWNNCTITNITVSGGVVGMYDNLTVTVYHTGRNCSLANRVQVDYFRLGDNESRDCWVQADPRPGQLRGMNSTFTTFFYPFSFKYNVPSISDLCAGKRVNHVLVSLKQGDITRTYEDTYNFSVNSTTFDQCKEFGVVVNYTAPYTNHSTSIVAITNASTRCNSLTCASYDAKTILFIGNYTILTNSSGQQFAYSCNPFSHDYVCPNDFQYNTRCTITDGGICLEHGLIDADCEIPMPMKCGNTTLVNGSQVKTCDVPTPTPQRYCVEPTACVFANETTGQGEKCLSFGFSTRNALGYNITCSNDNTWCPKGYFFNLLTQRCVNMALRCDLACDTVDDLMKRPPADRKGTTYWNSYINTPACFQVDATTGKKAFYCGVSSGWPEPIYTYLPIGVVYCTWSFEQEGFLCVGEQIAETG